MRTFIKITPKIGGEVSTRLNGCNPAGEDGGRKRVLGMIAGILVARHLKNPEDLFNSRPSPNGILGIVGGRMGEKDHAKDR